jgi:PAS domain S-box-containing protein
MHSATSKITPPKGIGWFIYLPIGIGLLIIISLIGYGYYTGERLRAVESPLLDIVVQEIKLESAATWSWIEEALEEAREIRVDPAYEHVEQAVAYLKALYDPEGRPPGAPPPEKPKAISQLIGRLSMALANWKELSSHINNLPLASQSIDLRAKLTAAYSDFSDALFEVEIRLKAGLETEIRKFRLVQAVLIGTCFLLAIGVAVSVRRYEIERSSNIRRMREANQSLHEEIGRRKATEHSMAERERLFHKVFNDSPVPIIIARFADMRIVDVNEWFLAVTGFEKEEILSLPLNDVVICNDPAARETFQQRISDHNQLQNIECQLPVKAGQTRTALLSATLVDLNGKEHILSAARDITEFKKAEQTLAQSERNFRSLFESAPDFIQLVDPQGVVLTANPAACMRLGFSMDEVSGRPLAEFLSPESRRRFAEQLPQLLDSGELRAEYDLVARTGAIIPVDCSATIVESGDGSVYIVLFQKDITERRNNELKFQAVHRFLIAANRNQDLHAILENFLEIIEEATACEAAAVRVEDNALAEPLLAVRGFDLSSCRPDRQLDSRLCTQLFKDKLKADESGFTSYGSFYCNSVSCGFEMEDGWGVCPVHQICGQPSYESFALIPIQGPHGRTGLIHIAYRDKNKLSMETIGLLEAAAIQLDTAIRRIRAEEALKCSHDELEQRVQERTEQLSATNERLKTEVLERSLTERSLVQHQQQLRELSSVLVQTEERERHRIATALHDGVGQMLAAAKIKLGSLRSSAPQEGWEIQLDDVRGLISLAIEETRSLTFELSPPVLYEIGLQSALEWMTERFQRKFGLPITVKGDGRELQLNIPLRILAFQSVRELCLNAIKHARPSRIDVFLFEDEQFLRIEVSDDGAGFDVKKRRKAGNDMGFGLFSIREQLRHHGGVLTIDSRPDRGTRVTLQLPLKDNNQGKGEDSGHD